MKVTNFKQDGDSVEFDVEGVNIKMLNAFRRTIISRVPVMAAEKVTVYNNSSILNDENLVHRIGLMPLTTDLKTYVPRGECTCKGKGCAKCTATITLDVSEAGSVYSGDFKTTDEAVKHVYEKMPLVKLMPGQKIKLEAEAILGYGSDHVKWQPGLASYEVKDKDKKSYHVVVESYGQLPVGELVKKTFEVVDDKIKELEKAVK